MIGSLNPKEEKALIDLKNRLIKKIGDNLIKIYLFGSKARGDYMRNRISTFLLL